MRVADSPSLRLTELTVEAWVRFSGTPGTYSTVAAKPLGRATDDSFAIGYQLSPGSHPVLGALFGGVNGNSDTEAAQYPWNPDAAWHYVAMTTSSPHSSEPLMLYLDALPVSTASTGQIDYDGQPLLFGGDSTTGPACGFVGTIDEVRVWSSVRTQAEIQQDMMQQGGGAEPSLVGYWSFNEGQGEVAHDGSGTGNDGQLGATTGVALDAPEWVASTVPF